jgi:hypothetical protein
MATGQKPFRGDTNVSVISAIIKDTPALDLRNELEVLKQDTASGPIVSPDGQNISPRDATDHRFHPGRRDREGRPDRLLARHVYQRRRPDQSQIDGGHRCPMWRGCRAPL